MGYHKSNTTAPSSNICIRISCTATLVALAAFGVSSATAQVSTKDHGRKTVGAEAGIDRLFWLQPLERRLKNGKRPPCIGPLGCKVEIPEDSPCRRPAKKNPDVVIDGVVPGTAPETWIVAYRLKCSACYEGGAGYLLLVKVDAKGHIDILNKVALKKSARTDIPQAIEIVSDDFDEDGTNEVACRYRYVREKKQKCTGMTDAAGFLLIARPGKRDIGVLLHQQMTRIPKGKGQAYTTDFRFEDMSDDGYPDLVMVRRKLDTSAGPKTSPTVQMVRCYDDAKRSWEETVYQGLLPADAEEVSCDVPVPDKPYVVVAAIHPEKKLEEKTYALAETLRSTGFKGSCTYDAKALGGFGAARYVTIVSAHGSRKDANTEKIAVRRAGFSPFVKELFKD